MDVAARLLRRHERGRAHDLALRADRCAEFTLQVAGDAEVGEIRAARGIDENVLGLDVAVDDAGVVRVHEGVRDFPHGAHHARNLQGRVGEVGASDVLHRDERDAVDVAALVDADDGRAVQARGEASFPQEALDVGGAGVAQILQRHRTVEGLVPGQIHGPRPPLTDPPLNLVLVGTRRDLGLGFARVGLPIDAIGEKIAVHELTRPIAPVLHARAL